MHLSNFTKFIDDGKGTAFLSNFFQDLLTLKPNQPKCQPTMVIKYWLTLEIAVSIYLAISSTNIWRTSFFYINYYAVVTLSKHNHPIVVSFEDSLSYFKIQDYNTTLIFSNFTTYSIYGTNLKKDSKAEKKVLKKLKVNKWTRLER